MYTEETNYMSAKVHYFLIAWLVAAPTKSAEQTTALIGDDRWWIYYAISLGKHVPRAKLMLRALSSNCFMTPDYERRGSSHLPEFSSFCVGCFGTAEKRKGQTQTRKGERCVCHRARTWAFSLSREFLSVWEFLKPDALESEDGGGAVMNVSLELKQYFDRLKKNITPFFLKKEVLKTDDRYCPCGFVGELFWFKILRRANLFSFNWFFALLKTMSRNAPFTN